jgi:uncharacterized membrane protein
VSLAPLLAPITTPRVRAIAPRIVLLLLRIVMAGVLLVAGGAKMVGVGWMVAVFHAIGLGQWLRYVVGIFEIVGGLALLVPTLAGAAALALVAMMLGAVLTEIVIVRRPPIAALAALAALMLIAWGHREDTRRLLARALALRPEHHR